MNRLSFELPDFTRLAWVSDRAREVWEPRVRRINDAWSTVAWQSVASGIRRCAILHLSPERLAEHRNTWEKRGLGHMTLQVDATPELRVAVGRPDALQSLTSLRDRRDHDGIGRLLGYPPCCRRFFERVWVQQRFADTTWAMAVNTAPPGDDTIVEVEGPALCNILHRWIGIRAVHHLPCRFNCAATERLGRRFLTAMCDAGQAQEAEWLSQILSWPVEWSTLHGIAEIRSPVLKVVTKSDATPEKYTVRRKGTAYPPEGATGLRFPYRTPAATTTVPLAPSVTAIPPRMARRADWYFRDNGFSSLPAMEAAHTPVIALARRALRGRRGAVLDLGCGNGVLLRRICAGRTGLAPYGIDRNATAISHARAIMPSHAARFLCADMFGASDWLSARRYALGLLMPGRLFEVSPDAAGKVLKLLAERSDRLLMYVYPGYPASLRRLADRAGLAIEEGSDSAALVRF